MVMLMVQKLHAQIHHPQTVKLTPCFALAIGSCGNGKGVLLRVDTNGHFIVNMISEIPTRP